MAVSIYYCLYTVELNSDSISVVYYAIVIVNVDVLDDGLFGEDNIRNILINYAVIFY